MLGAVLRLVFLLPLLAALGFGGWWLFVTPAPSPVATGPRAAMAERGPRAAAVTPPAAGSAALQTPFGDAMFRWRCTAGLREAIGEHPDWPLRRLAGFCLCVADRLRAEGLRDLVLSGGDTASAVAAAEASVCRR
ncbi:hypothetical protein [Neoroseomonas soli]|uniref:Uncharacterized protein n=1 Tax=Neoroseomonas soli TaxID=1081025 RepID=A0A9X9WY61_9PROT|nr:hypothetical protein [Neoroseomonas soli]MBR0672090.1 hypothetical protein [Neoroseomonas soli]